MKHGRRLRALLAGAALVCAGCSAQAAPPTTADDSIVIGVPESFTSYNTQSSSGRTATNLAVLNAVVPGFSNTSPSGDAVPNTALGSYRKVSDDPLQVRYTFSPDARWSDGAAVDCEDARLTWMANSNRFEGFHSADTDGYRLISQLECADEKSAFTVTYSQPYAEWQRVFDSLLPAHIAEAQTRVPDVSAAASSGEEEQIQALANFFNTGWDVPVGGSADPALMPSAGPYRIAIAAPGKVELVANEHWWGAPPRTARVAFAPVTDPVAAVAAGDVDVAQATPTAAALNQLQLADVAYRVGPSWSFDSLVFNAGGAAFATVDQRRALAGCVPREHIVAELYQPVDPSAAALKSNLLLPLQSEYSDLVSAQLAPQAVPEQTVRIRSDGSALQSATLELIRAACAPYGFTVVAAGDGAWDAALVSALSSQDVTGAVPRFATGGAANAGGYSNPVVDDLLYQLATTPDRTARRAIVRQLDKVLWQDLPAVPLATSPAMVAWRPGLSGMALNPAPGGLTWNLQDWG